MSLLSWIILFTLLGGALSVLAAALFLLLPTVQRTRVMPGMVSFAIGALLGAAFLAVLPHALAAPGVRDMHAITGTVLFGLLGFFLLEKLVLWRHCHTHECEVHGGTHVAEGRMPGATEVHKAEEVAHAPANNPSAGYLVLFGDAVHNFVDGILIAAAFMTDVHLGVVTALAVAAHEIPQEIGDFAILLHSGFSRGKALLYNILSSLTTVVGGVLAYFSLGMAQTALPYVLAIAASSFIYVAVADLIPGLHKRLEPRATLQQIVLIAAGVLTISFTHSSLH